MDVIEIRRSRRYAGMIVIIGCCMLIIGIALLLISRHVFALSVLVLGGLFLLIVGIIGFIKRTPVITLDHFGLTLLPCLGSRIAWSDIESVIVDGLPRGGRVIYINLIHAEPYINHVNRTRCYVGKHADNTDKIRIGISAEGLDLSIERIYSEMASRIKRAKIMV